MMVRRTFAASLSYQTNVCVQFVLETWGKCGSRLVGRTLPLLPAFSLRISERKCGSRLVGRTLPLLFPRSALGFPSSVPVPPCGRTLTLPLEGFDLGAKCGSRLVGRTLPLLPPHFRLRVFWYYHLSVSTWDFGAKSADPALWPDSVTVASEF